MMRYPVRLSIVGGVIGGLAMLAAIAAPVARAQVDTTDEVRRTFAALFHAFEAQAGGGARLVTSRPIEAMQRTDGLAAILPDLAVMGSGTVRLEIGTVTLTRREVNERHRWETEAPRQMRLVDGANGAAITVTSGSFAIEIDPRTQTIHDLRIDMRQVAMIPSRGRLELRLEQLLLASALNRRADGFFDRVLQARMANFIASDPDEQSELRLNDLSLSGRSSGFRLDALERASTALHDAATLPEVEQLRVFAREFFEFAFENSVAELTMEGLQAARRGRSELTLAHAALVSGIGDPTASELQMMFRWSHRGLVLGTNGMPNPANPIPYFGYVPEEMDLSIMIEHLPTAAVRRFIAEGYVQSGRQPLQVRPVAMETLGRAMRESRTTLRVEPFTYTSRILGAMLSGSLTGQEGAVMGYVGNGDLTMRGLDQAVREMRPILGDPAVSVVTILTALGQQGRDANGQPIWSYRVDLSPQGRFTLNGTDMSPILGLMLRGGGQPRR